MKTIFSPTARTARTRLTMMAASLCMLVTLPVHADEIHCELIENSQVSDDTRNTIATSERQ